MPQTDDKGVPFFAVFDALKRRKFFVIIPVILMTAGFAVYAYRLPASYRASALLAADPVVPQEYVKSPRPTYGYEYSTTVRTQEQLRTLREALFSDYVVEKLVREFKLAALPSEGKIPDSVHNDIEGRIKVELEGVNGFRIGFQGSDRAQVARITNRMAELFIERIESARKRRVHETSEFLDQELQKVRQKLGEQDDKIKQFKMRAVHSLPETTGSNIRLLEAAQISLAGKNEEIANDEAQKQAILAEIKGLESQGVVANRPIRERTPMDEKLDGLRLELKQAQARYTPSHPEVQRLAREVREAERMAASQADRPREPSPTNLRHLQLRAELQAINKRLEAYRTERNRLQQQVAVYSGRIAVTPQNESEITILMRDYQATRDQYNKLLETKNEAKLAEQLEQSDKGYTYRLVEPARIPSAPHSPQRGRIILLGLASSLGLGLVLAFFAEQMDTSFGDIDDFQNFTNVPVLTVIPTIAEEPQARPARREKLAPVRYPQVAAPDGSRPQSMDLRHLQKHHVVTLSDAASVAAEQYGILALKIRQHLGEASSKIIALTSAVGGEGKTTTAINLGLALAASTEKRVLLVECDLRKSRVHEYLGFKPQKGFADILVNPDESPDRHIWKVKDLFVIPGGSAVGDPVGMLASQRTRNLLQQLRERFPIIILDCPPILPIADSHILAGLADGVIIVVRARRTRRELFQRAVEGFFVSNLVGVVLNDVDYLRSRYAYAYQYYEKHYLQAS